VEKLPDSLTDLRGNQSSRIEESSRGIEISPRRYAVFFSFLGVIRFFIEVPLRGEVGRPIYKEKKIYLTTLPFARRGLKSSKYSLRSREVDFGL
jgi:hypothetical protein